jgi:hypothetical protein
MIKWDNFGTLINKNNEITIKGNNRWVVRNKNDSITIGWDNHGDIINRNAKIKIAGDNTNPVENENGKIKILWTNFSRLKNKNADIEVYANKVSMKNVNGDLLITSMNLEISPQWSSSSTTVVKSTKTSLFWIVTKTIVSSSSWKIIKIKSPHLNVTINISLSVVKVSNSEIHGERMDNSDVIIYHLWAYELINIKNLRKLLYEDQLLEIENDDFSLTYTPPSEKLYNPDEIIDAL